METRRNIFQRIFTRSEKQSKSSKMKDGDQNKFFFKSIKCYSNYLFFATILATVLIYFESGNVYNAIAIFLTVTWVIIFLRYFLWATYHYNVNFGLSDEEWERYEQAKDKQIQGEAIHEDDLMVPMHNPYRSQTFGLPPGTVRGMIALTLLFGALTLLIVCMGMTPDELENSLIRDQYEFFKTAFLMMIAFYFGDKSLKVLQKRWKNPNQPGAGDLGSSVNDDTTQAPFNTSELDDDDARFVANEPPQPQPSTPQKPQEPVVNAEPKTPKPSVELHERKLTDAELTKAINRIKTEDGATLTLPVLKAIIEVESSGSGNLKDGRAKILFEGHKFWSWLTKMGIKPEDHIEGNEDILYKSWTRKYYKGGAGEYDRLNRAIQINKTAAIYSASWGLFQIMGENLTSFIKSRLLKDGQPSDVSKYTDLDDFQKKQDESEYFHLLDFIAFIKTKTAKGKKLIDCIAETDPEKMDWATFAYGYNGKNYATNNYDTKLKAAYEKYKNA